MNKQQKQSAIFNWSSGKDSAFALYKIQQEESFDIQCLVTSVNKELNRVSMHGVRLELLDKQAESLELPLYKLMSPEVPSMEDYNNMIRAAMSDFKQQGADYSIFGDIFLEDLRLYREEQLKKVNMHAVFPLWKLPSHKLMEEFLAVGFKAIIVCVNDKYLDKSFVGRIIDHNFLKDLPADVDPCGENGEYHSFVFDGPNFKHPVHFTIGEVVFKEYQKEKNESDHTITNHDTAFYYCDLLPS